MKDVLANIVAKTPATVYTKLLVAFLAIVALLITFGAVALQLLSGMNQRSQDLTMLHRKTAAYRQLQHDTTGQLYTVTTALLAPDANILEGALRQLHQFRYGLDRVHFVSKDEMELFGRIREEHKQLISVVTKAVELTQADKIPEALELHRTRAVPLADKLERLTNEMVNRAEADMVAKIDDSNKAYLTSRWLVIGFAFASIGLALILGYAISGSLMGPVRRMDEQLMQIASGDFSQRIEVPNRDELGALANNLNRMSEELNRLYRQIATASSHKSEFLANMSHELRTPLNAIIGYSEMLMEDAEDKGRDDFISDLRKIHVSGKHLLTLSNDILDLSRIEAGKMELSPENFDITKVIEEVAGTVQPLAEKNSNDLEIQCARDLGIMHADLTKVRQILYNLLSNACKFTEHGTVSLNAVRDSAAGGDRLTIGVSDSGIGMTEKQMEKLFQPFSQVETGARKKYGGTGLGLVITKQFCEMMGGDITVRSEYGAGTTFIVRIPLEVPHKSAEKMSTLKPAGTGGKDTHD
jgi:signal transduction histidine kinase